MKIATICFLIDTSNERKCLLGLKKRGFGQGKYVGIGGKVEKEETVQMAASRETKEEIGVEISEEDLVSMGQIEFLFPAKPEWDHFVHIFVTEKWTGEPIESDEIKPNWYKFDDIPYPRMWQDAQHWLPLVLNYQKIRACFTFHSDNTTIKNLQIEPIMV